MKSACLRVLVCVLPLACVACTPVRSTLRPPYLIGGVVYDERGLQQYAESQCARKTGGAPPHEFTTDGCSLWPRGSWEECCVVHDMVYWCGGPDEARRKADRRLRSCAKDRSSGVNALLMYLGVRIGGSRWWPFPWRWGYGYSWPYRESEAQRTGAEQSAR